MIFFVFMCKMTPEISSVQDISFVFVFYFSGYNSKYTGLHNLQGLQTTKSLDMEIQNIKQLRKITQKKQCFCRGGSPNSNLI